MSQKQGSPGGRGSVAAKSIRKSRLPSTAAQSAAYPSQAHPSQKLESWEPQKPPRNFVIIWIKYNISATVPKKRDDNPQTQVDPHTGQTGDHRKIEIERVQKES